MSGGLFHIHFYLLIFFLLCLNFSDLFIFLCVNLMNMNLKFMVSQQALLVTFDMLVLLDIS